MTTLYGVAAILGGRVLNTGNRSEDVLGYSTFYGDSAGSYGPICDYTVSEVRQIGLALGAPEDLIMKVPDDGMCGSTDEQNLSKQLNIPNLTYERLDHLTRREMDEVDFTVDEINRIVELYNKMKFKIEIIRMPHPDSGMVDYFKEL
jgi:NAD+ synthase